MRIVRGIASLLLSAAIILFGAHANAFHSGGVAQCEGCHTMHNSLGGAVMTTALPQYQSGPFLLKASDQSSICLNCHEKAGDTGPNGYHVSTSASDMPAGQPPKQLTPGGDFGWLKKDYTWISRPGAAPSISKGERHGHNITAANYGYQADTTFTAAPGGSDDYGVSNYPANKLHCSSCHDPHGKYRLNADNGTFTTSGKPIYDTSSYGALPTATEAVGSYRLLAGKNYQPKSLTGSFAFASAPPIAVAPADYNRVETDNGSGQTIVAYGKNMSLWCANCHAQMHSSLGTVVHPADVALNTTGGTINNYNSYVKSGNLTGTASSSYWTLVPTQRDNYNSINTLKTDYMTASKGATNGIDRVMCLSCHRAHASGFDSMMRFGTGTTFVTGADSSHNPVYPDPVMDPANAQGRTVAETQQAYYGRPASVFSVYQRSLCNKCHAQD